MNDTIEKQDSWWKRSRVYIVSSLFIVLVMLVVLYAKKFWPFGEYSLLNGDFVMQGWAYSSSLHNKLLNGDSIFFTWESGYGINYYSNLAFYFNPVMLIFALIPSTMVLQTSTIIYILTLILTNLSMLVFLTHRPNRRLQTGDMGNMLFSLSYTLCMYVVSNTVNWNFLITAVCFPLIILGLESFVSDKKWKLYVCSLALAFLTCYYFAGLFCVFIVLYYLTLQFESVKSFMKKSFQILGLSVVAVSISAFLTLPTIIQLMNQTYSVRSYYGKLWFTNYLDVLQSFLVFNTSIGLGSSESSYGEVSLYFGLLPLLLATSYFMNPYIRGKDRIKKFLVFVIYMLAFDMNPLNYVMHLLHYPSFFPNRFSWFFTMFCVILGYENWVVYKEHRFKKILIPSLISSIVWMIVIVLCYLGASIPANSYVYTYSAVLIGLYLVLLLLNSISKKLVPRVLVILGCIEIVLSFSYSIIFRRSVVSIPRYNEGYVLMREQIDDYCRDEAHGFSRILTQRDFYGQANTGLLMNYKSSTAFASSINDAGIFLVMMGVYCGGNNYRHFTYTPATLSMFNNQYIYFNSIIEDDNTFTNIYTVKEDIYDNYPIVYQEGSVTIRENPEVLSLGYMINESAEKYEEDDTIQNINSFVESACGIGDVLEKADLKILEMETVNCQAALTGSELMVGHHMSRETFYGYDWEAEGCLYDFDNTSYDPTDDSYLILTCEAEEDGDYYVQMAFELHRIGILKKGEQTQVIVHVPYSDLYDYIEQFKIEFATFNYDNWERAHALLAQNQLEVSTASSGYIAGSIDADRDGLLFTSIAYDKNWHAYVDGVEVPVDSIDFHSFSSISIKKGYHNIEFRYKQEGFLPGIVISVCSLLVLIILGIWEKKRSIRQDGE